MPGKSTRRDILKAGTVAAGGLALGSLGFAKPKRDDHIRFALIGADGKASNMYEPCKKHGSLVAICDVDTNRLAGKAKDNPGVATYTDYRKMIEEMRDDIDAVVVTTPDHTHAPAAAMAMEAGWHCYCEKPLTRTIGEARWLKKIAAKTGVATQMGNQGSAASALRNAAAYVRGGGIGHVKEVHAWTDRPGGYWQQGLDRPDPKRSPRHLDWTLWLGPSMFMPYAERHHPFHWRGWWDFGCGALGDMGCHVMNIAYEATDLRRPKTVQALTSGHNRVSFPAWSVVTYEFADKQMVWYDGGKKPEADLVGGMDLPGNGCIMIGEKGTLFCPSTYGDGSIIVGEGEVPTVDFEESPGHFEEWARAINGGPRAQQHFGHAAEFTETVLIGNLAVWADGDVLEWDHAAGAVKGKPEYDSYINPPYTAGWGR